MQPRALLVAALLVLLASARAQEADTPFFQGFMKQAQKALSSVKELPDTLGASVWMEGGFNSLKDYWSTLTSPLAKFWPLALGDAPGTTPAPAV